MNKFYIFYKEPSYGEWDRISFDTRDEVESFILDTEYEEIYVVWGQEQNFDVRVNWQ